MKRDGYFVRNVGAIKPTALNALILNIYTHLNMFLFFLMYYLYLPTGKGT